ncbi:hypothetical protein GCK72_020540 [Caenorhabditis remanei]|uniref:receptor protein-tyrosine kinase n=1 Tax=Caenorhabditis remanei TaxID=31234 RepID=A0A6A5GH16_CAERE|nr:hypothetical protein GCK72_020540 [Caenorhabditis remanei]KAF1753983.1 hypothetical protein GCK72_020540 [Caenorhabditis remanei]
MSNAKESDFYHEEDFEIDIKKLKFLEVIEKGLFTSVRKAELTKGCSRLPVVLKSASKQEDAKQQRMILDELQVLTNIKKHPSILTFVGVILSTENHVSIVSEFAENGCLLEFLRSHQDSFKDQLENEEDSGFVILSPRMSNNEESLKNYSICTSDLLSFAYQIANGMSYLSGLNYVHRQLALRSIYLTTDKTIRIGDLGLARRNDEKHYYRIVHKDLPLPFHWLAPETLGSHKFTEKSDVWSFAVCLYELFTLGKMPYDGVEDVLKYLERGRRLPKPEYCHQEIYNFMLTCWNMDPEKRPTFSDCVNFFENHLQKFATGVLEIVKEKMKSAKEHQKQLEALAK